MRDAVVDIPKRLKVLELCGGLSTGCVALKLLLGGDSKVELVGYWDTCQGVSDFLERGCPG
eukprot:8469811-Prorocentrum_lima.AAC.1